MRFPSKQRSTTWGLALSGGTACGFANIGVLEVLEEHDLKPDYVAGSSMGAVVGALYALGKTPKEIHKLVSGLSPFGIAKISENPLKGGLHGGFLRQQIQEHLEPIIGEKRIADCVIPFVCIAGKVRKPIEWMNILKDGFTAYAGQCVERCIFPPDTKIMDAILASTAIPVIFSPTIIEGEQYIDLISFGAIPARSLKETHHPDILVATDTNPAWDSVEHLLPKGWKKFLNDGQAYMQESKAICDLVIKPKLPYPQYRFDKADEFIESGRVAMEKSMKKLRGLFEDQ